MKKKKEYDDLILDDYIDENFYSLVSLDDEYDDNDDIEVEDESDYSSFNDIQEVTIDMDEDIEEEEEIKAAKTISKNNLSNYMLISSISNWVAIIGVVLALIVVISFIISGSIKSLLLFLLLLLISYGLGYICTYFIYQMINIK